LDPGRQLGPDICVESGGGRLILERFVDGAPLIVAERRERIGDGDQLVVGRVLLRELRRHRIGIRRRAGNGQGAVDEGCVRLRMSFRGVRTRLFLAHLAGRGLLRFFLLRPLLCVGRWRLLGGSKADAAGKYQRERTRRQEMASHGCLLSSGLRERYPQFHALRKRPPPYLLARQASGGRSTKTTTGGAVWFHAARVAQSVTSATTCARICSDTFEPSSPKLAYFARPFRPCSRLIS